MVTDQLSSADIIHLIATCKEIKTYLTDDKTIYASIAERANCDGKGIEARANCFYHWKGDPTQANVRCGGSDCQPCDGCQAMVCDVSLSNPFDNGSTHIRQECRFHMTYMIDSPCCRDDPSHWESHEVDCAMELDVVRRCHGYCGDCVSGYIFASACNVLTVTSSQVPSFTQVTSPSKVFELLLWPASPVNVAIVQNASLISANARSQTTKKSMTLSLSLITRTIGAAARWPTSSSKIAGSASRASSSKRPRLTAAASRGEPTNVRPEKMDRRGISPRL